jgi:hypothetical protein
MAVELDNAVAAWNAMSEHVFKSRELINLSQAYRRHSHKRDGNVVRNPPEKNIMAESVNHESKQKLN